MNLQFPALSSQDLLDAKLYATRQDMVAALALPDNPVIAEVGVAIGGFSKHMVATFQPAEFHAFDIFTIHHAPLLWGKPTVEVLKGMTHFDFYKAEMDAIGANCIYHVGDSAQCMARIPHRYFDLIYIDAAHDYNSVKRDANLAANTLKDDGILVFNDYTMYDPFARVDYGIVQVVNEMVVNEGWKVIGFAFENHMFCDIAIRRPPGTSSIL